MLKFLICSLLFIKTNGDLYETDFIYDENEEQHMMIGVPEEFKKVKDAYFLVLIKKKDINGYVRLTNFYKYTRTIRDKKEYDEFVEKKKSLLKSSEEYKELKLKKFKTIFVDMKWIEKDSSVAYAFEFKLDPYKKIITKPFHYSEESKKWEMVHLESKM